MREELLAAIKTIQDNSDYIRRLVALSNPDHLEFDIWGMVAQSNIQIDDSRGEVLLLLAGEHELMALDQSLIGMSISEARAAHRKMYDEARADERKEDVRRKIVALKRQQEELLSRQRETDLLIKKLEES